MKLYQAAYTSRVYDVVADYDSSYRVFRGAIENKLDFSDETHVSKHLFDWLNKWGCRMDKNRRDVFTNKVQSWAQKHGANLPSQSLLYLNDHRIEKASKCFESLAAKTGPTVASKILFAARPDSLLPWDGEISKSKKGAYATLIRDAQNELTELISDANVQGIAKGHILTVLKRNEFTLAKVVDEYNWVTITRKARIPDHQTLKDWAIWSK